MQWGELQQEAIYPIIDAARGASSGRLKVQNLAVRQTCQPLRLGSLSGAILGAILATGFAGESVRAEETAVAEASAPFAVVAISSVDRFLEDLDALAESIGQPNYAKFIRGFLSGMNDLRGIDRDRPLGSLMYFQSDDADKVRPVFFFPTTDLDELFKTIRFGESLRLKRDKSTDELILQTEHDVLPVVIRHDFVFLGKKQDLEQTRLEPLDPAILLGDFADANDIVVMLRRAGIPQSAFEEVQREIQADADEELARKPEESDEEYELRCNVSNYVFGLIAASVREWQSTSAGLNFVAETGELSLNVESTVDPTGKLSQLLASITSIGTHFEQIISQPSPLTVATSFTLPEEARDLTQQILSTVRNSVEMELDQSDDEVRNAVFGLIDSVEKTVLEGHIDLFGQLLSQGEDRVVLTGGIRIADADNFATCLRQVLPFAVEAKEIREVQLNVASADGVEIHRLIPEKVRHRDRRLYGEQAAIYLAAGRGAFWLAVGEEQAIPALSAAMARVGETTTPQDIRASTHELTAAGGSARPLLSVTINLSRWTQFLESHKGKKASRVASLMGEAFPDSTGDTARLAVHTTPSGLRVQVDFAEGYSRLLGLAVARKLHKGDQ
ncbi:MAG: hypothetical protein KDA86_04375 [Planctomycetaceae bacterium]|nr:hypothetical protein [Planctomycetaceae bacterium]